MIKSIVCISDTHFGCKLGLCPPKVKLDEGGYYHHSELQGRVWKMWLEFWRKWVPLFTKNEPYVLVHVGDALDGVHHNSSTQITHNLKDQINIAETVLSPIVNQSERYFHLRGTGAHVGASGEWEELIAETLRAEPDELGNHARWSLWLMMNKKLIHFSHHIGGTGSSSYESTGVYKELVEAFVQAGRFEDKPPDVIIRGHRHRHFKTQVGNRWAEVLPGWQLKTPYVYRLASGRAGPPQFGGVVIRSGKDDPIYSRNKLWHVKRSKEVVI